MPTFTLSLYRLTLTDGEARPLPGGGVATLLVDQGRCAVGDTVLEIGAGHFVPTGGTVTAKGPGGAEVIVFTLTHEPTAGALASEKIDVDFPCLLRLDEVVFPPGAQAYRHVHPGPGFRHLRKGALHLEADDHSFSVTAGDTWFEPALSPVRATASDTEPETGFVRCMILPVHYAGKPTISILDPQDAVLPKRQVTHRHVDQRLTSIQVDAG